MTVNAEAFKKALQDWASGVTIVTTTSSSNEPLGMTATSFTSVSMEPPQILVCINDSALTSAAIAENHYFAVNILGADQQAISNLFAGGASVENRFESVAWSKSINAVPVLDESIASLECKVVHQIKAGTHWVIIGEVKQAICRSGKPLLYFRTRYRQLNNESD
ncbi:MAG: flavin reductase family protein [Methylococcaceae bacterium]